MNRQIITKQLFVDMDEFLLLQIEPFTFLENNTGKIGHKVIGVTKQGMKIQLYEESASGEELKCYQWIQENWIGKQSKGLFK